MRSEPPGEHRTREDVVKVYSVTMTEDAWRVLYRLVLQAVCLGEKGLLDFIAPTLRHAANDEHLGEQEKRARKHHRRYLAEGVREMLRLCVKEEKTG